MAVVSFLPLLGAFLVGNGSILKCYRTDLSEGECELVRGISFARQRLSFKLSKLKNAEVSKSPDRETGEYCYTPAIVVTTPKKFYRAYSLTPNTCSQSSSDRIESRINRFISTPSEKNLHIQSAKWTEVLLYSTPFLAIALLASSLIVRDSGTSYIFDRDRNCLTIVYKKWLRTVNVEQYSLDTITAVNSKTCSDSSHDYVVIQLESDKKIELAHNDCNSQEIFLTLKQFLNL